MSKTHVRDLVGDFEDEFIIGGSGAFKYEKLYSKRLTEISDIEIVPRKIVEMIIKKCEDTIRKQEFIMDFYASDSYISSNAQAARINTMQLKGYAESLLKQFEEEGE